MNDDSRTGDGSPSLHFRRFLRPNLIFFFPVVFLLLAFVNGQNLPNPNQPLPPINGAGGVGGGIGPGQNINPDLGAANIFSGTSNNPFYSGECFS